MKRTTIIRGTCAILMEKLSTLFSSFMVLSIYEEIQSSKDCVDTFRG